MFRVGTAYIVVAWLVIQVVETIFPAFGFSDSVVRMVVIILAAGFLPSLVFAWVFELAPVGLLKEKEVGFAGSRRPCPYDWQCIIRHNH